MMENFKPEHYGGLKPQDMQNLSIEQLYGVLGHALREIQGDWARVELTRRQYVEIRQIVVELHLATSEVRDSSRKLEKLTERLNKLTWALIFLTIAAVAVPIGIEVWKARHETPAVQTAPPVEQPKPAPPN
jgi:hypothetical protein